MKPFLSNALGKKYLKKTKNVKSENSLSRRPPQHYFIDYLLRLAEEENKKEDARGMGLIYYLTYFLYCFKYYLNFPKSEILKSKTK
jgi:hypothetical protein